MKQYNLGKITDEKIKEAESLIKQNGGKIFTDDSFSIKGIKGRYDRQRDNLIISIIDKPFLIGWGTIESQLVKFFS